MNVRTISVRQTVCMRRLAIYICMICDSPIRVAVNEMEKKLKNWNRKTHPNRLNSIVLFVAITDCYTVCSTAYLTRSQRQPHIWSLHKDHPDQTTRHHFRIVHLCKCILVSVLMFLHSFWIEREENTTHIQMNLIKLYSQEIEKRNRLSCRGYFTHWTFHGHIFRLVCLSVCVCVYLPLHFSQQPFFFSSI